MVSNLDETSSYEEYFKLSLTVKPVKTKVIPYSTKKNDPQGASSIIDQRLTSGSCAFACGRLVDWKSKKQQVVEAEFIPLANP